MYLDSILVPIACGCILPITLVWLNVRQKANENQARTQIIMAALEKNPNMDVEELIRRMSPKSKLLKEKLLALLRRGCLSLLIGIGLIIGELFMAYSGGIKSKELAFICCVGVILIAIGIAFLINYYVGKKMLAKEMEAEQKNLQDNK
ncbi:MAG: hypothetical protein IKR17_11230 [Bacteroidales bacterium]|jgi:hypothetical protein|nr:hypothetical protein [Bacteroidales bacterium]